MLRPYQVTAVEAVLGADNPVLTLPTGAGKTVCAVEIIRRHAGPVLFLAHRRELIAQAAAHLLRYGITAGVIQSGYAEHRNRPVQVASVQTLSRRTLPAATLIIIDEAHHARAESYLKILDAYDCPRIGLTATPARLDGRGLGKIFNTIIVGATARELCDDGTLIAPTVYAAPAPSMSGVAVERGDYNLTMAAERFDRAKITGDIVAHWRKHASGRRTVVFAINVAHSKHIVERFGSIAEHLDGSTPHDVRAGILRRLRSGETRVVSNCQVLTEGWDLPALEVAVIARPTASVVLHLQMIGRIMRAADGKAGALCLDHAGNHHRHGMVTDDRVWSLADDKPKQVKSTIRTCPACYLIIPAGATECDGCGYTFPSRPVAVVKEADGTLSLLNKLPFATRQAAWNQFEAQRIQFNFKPGYSLARYKQKFGDWPLVHDGQLIEHPNHAAILSDLVAVARRKGYKTGWAAFLFKTKFHRWPTREERANAGL